MELLDNIGADLVIGLFIRFLVIYFFVYITKIKTLPRIPPVLGVATVAYYFVFAQSYEELGPFTVMGILLPEVIRFTFSTLDKTLSSEKKKETNVKSFKDQPKPKKKKVHRIDGANVKWRTTDGTIIGSNVSSS